MTSKSSQLEVLCIDFFSNTLYDEHLQYLLDEIDKRNDYKNIILAPELYLSGFDYEAMDRASDFSEYAMGVLKQKVDKAIVVLTLIRKLDDGFVNQVVVIHNHKIIHTQEKSKLFKLGKEDKYFASGDQSQIKPFEIDGVRYGILVCFELRFKELWKQLEGCDIIMVPAKWGIARKHHFEVLSKALAVMNQCFVAATSSGDKDVANSSMTFSPSGMFCDLMIDLKEVAKMRRYIMMEE
ncbi:MAG: carbon-nitrogen hydrolase family protein [Campylobacterales bacterium]|nr:carbon-nitrogen hydrolase family protein [Campylobacterales bacterium]